MTDTENVFTVTVAFGPDVSPSLKVTPRVLDQLKYVEDAIRDFMQSHKYKAGLRAAALGMPPGGVLHEVGDPPTYARLEESYMKHKYGQIEPDRGEVGPRTFCWLLSKFGDKTVVERGSILFNKAWITWNAAIPEGHVLWKYENVFNRPEMAAKL